MRKNTFAIFGILAVLLLSLGLTSAYDGFELSITGQGSSSNLISGINGTTHSVIVNANNILSEGTVYVNWSVVSTTTMILPTGANVTTGIANITGFTFTMPESGTYETLTANIHDATTFAVIGTSTVRIYFNETSAPAEIEGCNDPAANNYNSSATNNESCTYDTTPSDTLCVEEGYDEDGDLEISDFDVNNKGKGDDDAWQYLDEIEVTVEIENTNRDDSISDIEVMMVIMDDTMEDGGNDVTNDFDIKDDILTSIGKLKDGDEESVTFIIDELPADIEDGTYYMYIMAYEDNNEEEQCVSESTELGDDYYFKFTVESVDYEDSVVAEPSDEEAWVNTHCGQNDLKITFPVYNLGTDKEEKVFVKVYNTEMNIEEFLVIDNLRNGKMDTVSFLIDIPSQLIKERYDLKVMVRFDWDDDKDEKEYTSYNEGTYDKTIRLNILECKAALPSITANLESETKLGEDLIVKTTIKNNGKLNEFIIAPTGFETWADLVSVTPAQTEIASGNTQEVLITLSPKQSGSQTFSIRVVVDGETYNRPVSVNIKEEEGIFPDLGISKTAAYLIMAIASLLVLIFLTLIIRISRKPVRAAEF